MGQDLDSVILESVKTSLLDSALRSEEKLRPKIVYNDVSSGKDVRSVLIDELESCESYDFSVAFITKDGIASIAQPLLSEGRKGRILTTDYQAFNDPEMFRYLLDHQGGFEVRVCSDLHTKGYIFHNPDGGDTMLIGSSNLTQYALKQNHEWNLRITSAEDGELLRDTEREFRRLWDSAHELTEEWIQDYALRFDVERQSRRNKTKKLSQGLVTPNSMQVSALEELKKLRSNGKSKALVIAATGTGKTYLSAFDVRECKPSRVLFLVHRENILIEAKRTYETVFQNGADCGLYTGTIKEKNADYLFSTIQTMSKHLDEFRKNEFDYIVCDEVHHLHPRAEDSGDDVEIRNMYARIIDYFTPRFMLGMTATPERTDGANIYQVFDYNVAQEVRLNDALKADLLCPFHYFGIADLYIDGIEHDTGDFTYLYTEERVKHIIENIEKFPHSGRMHKGLMFCSRVEECKGLSEALNSAGYHTVALSAENGTEEREDAVRRLQSEGEDHIDFILTRDIFNEGVDIPGANEVVLLRPTESVIVYIQQLGRGLRKAKDKEFLSVIDFIGNYKNNFMIPMALYGNNTYDSDDVRKDIILNRIPGVSTVSFDRITKEAIFKSIGSGAINSLPLLTEQYKELGNKLGRAPTLCDLYLNDSIKPTVVIEKFGCLNTLLERTEFDHVELNEDEKTLIQFLSKFLVSGKRPYEFIIVRELLENSISDIDRIMGCIKTEFGIEPDEDSLNSSLRLLSNGFLDKDYVKKYGTDRVLEYHDGRMRTSIRFAKLIKNPLKRTLVEDIVECASLTFRNEYLDTYDGHFSLHKKYSRNNAQLYSNTHDFKKNFYGYMMFDDVSMCPIFVTYNKGDSTSSQIDYEEYFVNRTTFRWATQSIGQCHLINGEIDLDTPYRESNIYNADKLGIKLPLFIQKDGSEAEDHYYLGFAHPVMGSQKVIMMPNKKGVMKPVLTFELSLEHPVDEKIYRYLTAPIETS